MPVHLDDMNAQPVFNPGDHPRDREGRFAIKPGAGVAAEADVDFQGEPRRDHLVATHAASYAQAVALIRRNKQSAVLELNDPDSGTHHATYFTNGVMDRENGPAYVDFMTGAEQWYRDDQLHRDHGPAIVIPDTGEERWYRHGVEVDAPPSPDSKLFDILADRMFLDEGEDADWEDEFPGNVSNAKSMHRQLCEVADVMRDAGDTDVWFSPQVGSDGYWHGHMAHGRVDDRGTCRTKMLDHSEILPDDSVSGRERVVALAERIRELDLELI